MAAKFQGPFLDPLITNKSMATSFNGTPINHETKDNLGIQFSWAGANPIGTINVQVSLDFDPRFPTDGTWTLLDDSSGDPIVITPGGAAGTGYFSLNQLEAPWVQVVYTTASGSVGTLTAKAVAKAV
jgi:hypothetical protein